MLAFSRGLSNLSLSNWVPQPTAEAPEKLARIAENAAISRLRPIADGPNQWEIHRSNGVTVCQSSLGAAMVGSESGPGTGSMGTCAGSPSPPSTGDASSSAEVMDPDSVWLGDRQQGNHAKRLQGNKRDCRVATRSPRPSRALSDIIITIITFTRERPAGFRHASQIPRVGG
jgi:hypothetical protein